MYIHRKTSKPVGPAWIDSLGIVLLLVAGFLLYMVIKCLATGEIIKLSRVDPGVITRDNNPSEFWMSEIFFSYFGVLLLALAVRSFKNAVKRRQK
jgi:hypothetical protein